MSNTVCNCATKTDSPGYQHEDHCLLANSDDSKMVQAIARCHTDVMADKPEKGRWAMYLWHRRWRKKEFELFQMGGMYGSVNWVILKETLNRIGGFW